MVSRLDREDGRGHGGELVGQIGIEGVYTGV